jgi:hypothetical protein
MDIPSEIFTHTAAGSLLAAMSISHVCSQWRRVALSISRLWDHFDYSLGIWIAQLQMSRVSPDAAISVRISLWDLDSCGSATEHNTALRSIQFWLLEMQIIYFPQWNALHLGIFGDVEEDTVAAFFDIFNNRDDELDSLVVRVTQEFPSLGGLARRDALETPVSSKGLSPRRDSFPNQNACRTSQSGCKSPLRGRQMAQSTFFLCATSTEPTHHPTTAFPREFSSCRYI